MEAVDNASKTRHHWGKESQLEGWRVQWLRLESELSEKWGDGEGEVDPGASL